jgi:hypothetical protein
MSVYLEPVETNHQAQASAHQATGSCDAVLSSGQTANHCLDLTTEYSWRRQGNDVVLLIAPI